MGQCVAWGGQGGLLPKLKSNSDQNEGSGSRRRDQRPNQRSRQELHPPHMAFLSLSHKPACHFPNLGPLSSKPPPKTERNKYLNTLNLLFYSLGNESQSSVTLSPCIKFTKGDSYRQGWCSGGSPCPALAATTLSLISASNRPLTFGPPRATSQTDQLLFFLFPHPS